LWEEYRRERLIRVTKILGLNWEKYKKISKLLTNGNINAVELQ
jgi:predicted transcriptional regulator